MREPLEPFDGAAWATLTPEQQAAIGAAALDVLVAGVKERLAKIRFRDLPTSGEG